jgi:hypothetical protein
VWSEVVCCHAFLSPPDSWLFQHFSRRSSCQDSRGDHLDINMFLRTEIYFYLTFTSISNESCQKVWLNVQLAPLSITFWLLYSRANHCIKGYLVAILPSRFILLHLSFLYPAGELHIHKRLWIGAYTTSMYNLSRVSSLPHLTV